MQKSVLAEIIRSLNKKEVREVSKWLQSPAHNQRQDVIRLFDYLTKSLTNSDENLEKEHAWAAVFPAQPYDDAYMRQVMYFLLKAVEEYLVFEDYTGDKIQYQMALMRTYRQRHLEKAYKQVHRTARESLETQPLRDSYYLRSLFFLEQEYGRWANIIPNASANLQETADALEKWFFSERLQITYAMLAHQSVYKTAHYTEGTLAEVLNYVEKEGLLKEAAIAAYYYAYKLITSPEEEESFNEFEHLILDSTEPLFSTSEIRHLYLTALNYCTAKVNKGKIEYCRRALKFYRSGAEKGILLENNVMTRYTFGNAVAFAVKVGEFEWAKQFIERFQHFLEEKERNSIVNFNLSRIYFEKGEYGKARSLLLQFEYNDMLFNIIAKTMLLKIYFEEDEYDLFESLLESLRIYLQRKEALDPARKAAYKNMISLMKKLVGISPYAKAQKDKLRELIRSTNPLMERDWLLKQLDNKR